MRTTFLWLLVPAVLVGCGSGPLASPSTFPGPDAVPSEAPTVSPVWPSPIVSEAPSAEPTTAPSRSAAVPTPTPAKVKLSAAETRLLDELRADSRISCGPRRTNLPPGATVGVECWIDSDLVERVGAYGFEPNRSAVDAYVARLTEQGITLGSGDCAAGKPGDANWPVYLPDEGSDGTGHSELRIGCFRDTAGNANIRLTCYGDVYLGVLGKGTEIAPLYAWTERVAAGESPHRDPPGLCARSD